MFSKNKSPEITFKIQEKVILNILTEVELKKTTTVKTQNK